HLDVENALAGFEAGLSARQLKKDKADLKGAQALVAKAHTRDSLQAVEQLTTAVDGRRRIVSDPPLVVPIGELTGFDTDQLREGIRRLLATYRDTLRSDQRHLFDHLTLDDVAHKVVGVGSVGTRAWILLFEADLPAGALLLQAKQAQRSALAGYAGES